MILGSDHILPSNYIKTIIDHMDHNRDIAICSGQIKNEKSKVPRGSGRIVKSDFWRTIGLQYPLKFGFETYLLIKAQQIGYRVNVLNDLISLTNRPTRKSYKKETYISYGKSLRASWLYSIIFCRKNWFNFFEKSERGYLHASRVYQ